VKKTKTAAKDTEDQFYAGVERGLKGAQKVVDDHLLHSPRPIPFIERIAFIFGGEVELLSRLHRDISSDIELKISTLSNDMP
jgi:hypothetical protein